MCRETSLLSSKFLPYLAIFIERLNTIIQARPMLPHSIIVLTYIYVRVLSHSIIAVLSYKECKTAGIILCRILLIHVKLTCYYKLGAQDYSRASYKTE